MKGIHEYCPFVVNFSVSLKIFRKKKKKNKGEGCDLEHKGKSSLSKEELCLSSATKRAGRKHGWSLR